jgi:hypothetical protein
VKQKNNTNGTKRDTEDYKNEAEPNKKKNTNERFLYN